MEFIYSQRWCELVFENRNKNYGAYHLRQNESNRLLHSWLIAMIIIATAIFGIAIPHWRKSSDLCPTIIQAALSQ